MIQRTIPFRVIPLVPIDIDKEAKTVPSTQNIPCLFKNVYLKTDLCLQNTPLACKTFGRIRL